MIRNIELDELLRRLDGIPEPVVIEALPAQHYHGGHLPGAICVPPGEIATRVPQLVHDTTAPIIVYCASVSCRNSDTAATELVRLGYENVYVYIGGKQDWRNAGLPLA